MRNNNLVNYLGVLSVEANKSTLKHKHGCVALRNGHAISPCFHNYMKSSIFGHKCWSVHAELCVVKYLVNSLWYEKGNLRCLL